MVFSSRACVAAAIEDQRATVSGKPHNATCAVAIGHGSSVITKTAYAAPKIEAAP
jgi:hypothetical protein